MGKRKVTLYISEKVWLAFLQKCIRKHGRAAGGVLSAEAERALKANLRR
jgi:hypothetical protein